jgi:hypothetical protein
MWKINVLCSAPRPASEGEMLQIHNTFQFRISFKIQRLKCAAVWSTSCFFTIKKLGLSIWQKSKYRGFEKQVAEGNSWKCVEGSNRSLTELHSDKLLNLYTWLNHIYWQHHHATTPLIIYNGYSFGLPFRPSSDHASFRIKEKPHNRPL